MGERDTLSDRIDRLEQELAWLRRLYQKSLRYAASDPEVSLMQARKAAEAGHPFAQFLLGVCYENGIAVDASPEVALEWYRKAAEQGDADAQVSIGMMYRRGEYVKQDVAEALRWYRRAAAQDHDEAQARLNESLKGA